MAEAKGKCPKCGKPYERLGKRYDAHVAACTGATPWVAKPEGRRRKGAAPETSPLSALDQLISFTKNRKLDLERQKELVREQITIIDNEIASLNQTVDLLQQAKKE